MSKLSWFAACAMAAILPCGAANAQSAFTFVNGSYPGAVDTFFSAINKNDQIVGYALIHPDEDDYVVFSYANGTFTNSPGSVKWTALNDAGIAAGEVYYGQYDTFNIATGVGTPHFPNLPKTKSFSIGGIDLAGNVVLTSKNIAYLDNGSGTTTPVNAPRAQQALMNPSGTIAVSGGGTNPKASIVENGQNIPVKPPGAKGVSILFITNDGTVGGYYVTGKSQGEGFTLAGQTYTSFAFPGGTSTVVTGIGPAGQVVGSFFGTDKYRHGFVFYQGSYHQIDYPGSPGTTITAITANGTIMGNWTPAVNDTSGFTATCATQLCTR